jgi:hypothetical protein
LLADGKDFVDYAALVIGSNRMLVKLLADGEDFVG